MQCEPQLPAQYQVLCFNIFALKIAQLSTASTFRFGEDELPDNVISCRREPSARSNSRSGSSLQGTRLKGTGSLAPSFCEIE